MRWLDHRLSHLLTSLGMALWQWRARYLQQVAGRVSPPTSGRAKSRSLPIAAARSSAPFGASRRLTSPGLHQKVLFALYSTPFRERGVFHSATTIESARFFVNAREYWGATSLRTCCHPNLINRITFDPSRYKCASNFSNIGWKTKLLINTLK